MAQPPSDRSKYADEAFLREVDDAVRASDLQKFGKKWGLILIALVVVGLASFAGYIWWSNQQVAKAGKQGEAFVVALDQANADRLKAADTQFAKIAEGDAAGYRTLAVLMQANIAMKQGDSKKAAGLYKKVEDDTGAAQPLRDLALLRRTAAEFDGLKPQEVVDRLKPLAKPGDPWFGTAGEMTAIAYMKMNREDLAGPIFAAIVKDKDVPESTRSRARQIAGMLGVDTVDASNPAVKAGDKADGAGK